MKIKQFVSVWGKWLEERRKKLYKTHGSGGLVDSRSAKDVREVTKEETHDGLLGRQHKKLTRILTTMIFCVKTWTRQSQNVNQKSERQAKHERRHLLKLSARLLESEGLLEAHWLVLRLRSSRTNQKQAKIFHPEPLDHMHVKIEGQNHADLYFTWMTKNRELIIQLAWCVTFEDRTYRPIHFILSRAIFIFNKQYPHKASRRISWSHSAYTLKYVYEVRGWP
jgi:hypothetical protein